MSHLIVLVHETKSRQILSDGHCNVLSLFRFLHGQCTPRSFFNRPSRETRHRHLSPVRLRGEPEDVGNANPDLDFRFDSPQGPAGGYIFNLKTSGLGSGTYSLQFTAGSDPNGHAVSFGVK